MASIRRRTSERIRRRTAGSNSAEQVECCDELITDILSRVSTRDVLRMSTVSKRWRTLIFDPGFARTHYKNCHRESIFCLIDIPFISEEYEFRSSNSQTGNLSIVPFPWEDLDCSPVNKGYELYNASNGLMCFYPSLTVDTLLWVYNPVRKFVKKMTVPFKVDIEDLYFAEICYMQNTVKFVMAGYFDPEERRYTLVFDSHSNSWYEGPPLLQSLDYSSVGAHLFFNGVIYFPAKVESEIRDTNNLLHMIIGYDVNEDKWGFPIFVPASVGSIFCLFEWEGNLLVCASNSPHEEILPASAASSNHERIEGHSDGHFVFWILDTKHKQWIRERELDLSHHFHTSWKVSASGGVVWFACGYKSVIVYHMKTRHCSTHQLDDPSDWWQKRQLDDSWWQKRHIPFVTFEPTLLSF